MEESYVTNNHLKAVLIGLDRYIQKGEEAPAELFLALIEELKVSTLLIPGYIENDALVYDIINNDDTGQRALMLFCDDDEFLEMDEMNPKYNLIPHDIGSYMELINDDELDGMVIDYANLCFFLPRELLNEMPLEDDFTVENDFEGYGPEQLRNIAETLTNDSMLEYMCNTGDEIDLDELMVELSSSTLLDLVGILDDLGEYENDGIIELDRVSEWEVCTINVNDEDYALLYTSKDAILETMDITPGYYPAYQIVVLSEFIRFVLENDMEGIVINPGIDDFLISRPFLFAYSEILDNPSFKRAADYAFPL